MKRIFVVILFILTLGCNEKVTEKNDMGTVEYYRNSEGEIDGVLTQYHKNGRIYWKANFVDGQKQGKSLHVTRLWFPVLHETPVLFPAIHPGWAGPAE